MAKHRFVHLFLASAFWLSMGTMAYAQAVYNRTVTLSIKKAKLGKILKTIQEKSAIHIVYSVQLVDKVAAQSVVANNEKLTDLLERLLKGTGLEYVIEKNVIIVRAKRKDDVVSTTVGSVTLAVNVSTFVSGMVKTRDGKPKAAVTVVNLETNTTVATDYNGNFAIPGQVGDRLQFSYVGFRSQRQTLKNTNALQIVMEPQEEMLDEVVLTGYQTIEKKLSTGSIYTLKGKDVAEPNVPNVASMLQGKVPGLSIETLSGSPNSIPRMRMRGTTTLMGNANPIWVIDGIIRENPIDVNPDNPMGLEPSFFDTFLRSGINQANADLMGNSINGINVNDIESINFLKDAAATALYGTRAANGVIVITTKKGKAGGNVINYSTSLGFVQRPSYKGLSLMNSKERVQISRELIDAGLRLESMPTNIGYESVYKDLLNHQITEAEFNMRVGRLETLNTDWFDLLFRNSFNQSHSLSLSGGSEKTTYHSSLNYSNNKGAAREDGLSSIGGRLALSSQLNKRLHIDFQLNGNYNKSSGYNPQITNPYTYALRTSRTVDPDIFYESKEPVYGAFTHPVSLHFNALNEIEQSGNHTKTTEFASSFNLSYNILKGLDFQSLFGAQFSTQNAEQYSTERSYDVAKVRGYDYGSVLPGGPEESMTFLPFGGILDNRNANLFKYSWRNMLTYQQKLFNDRDQMTFNLGQEINSTRREGIGQYVYGYLKDRGESIVHLDRASVWASTRKENKIENQLSVYGTASYAFDQKYILDASMRVEASNRFGQYTNSRFLPAWSVSGRWNATDEPWLRDSKLISNLNFRSSYGVRGNAVSSVGPDLILTIPVTGAIHPVAQEYQLSMSSLAYPDLRWEKTSDVNFGVEIGLLKSLINIDAQLYGRKTQDALTYLDVPEEYGVRTMIINGGTITNKGWDLAVSLNLIRKKDWSWSINGNTSKNINNITKGPDHKVFAVQDYLSGRVQLTDQPLGTFYVFDFTGLNPENGLPLLSNLDDDPNAVGKGLEERLIKAGVRNYTLTGGLGSNLRYRNWSLSAQFSFGFGAHKLRNPLFNGQNRQHVPNPEQNMQRALIDRWRKPGDELHTNIPALVEGNIVQDAEIGRYTMSRYAMYDASDILLSKADYLKCRNLRLGYTLPSALLQKLHVSNASLALDMTNVFRIAGKDWKGQDPELPGVGTSALPQLPTYNLSINVSF